MVVDQICYPFAEFIAHCIGETVGDIFAWYMAAYALQGAF
jgi:hypothetical protein